MTLHRLIEPGTALPYPKLDAETRREWWLRTGACCPSRRDGDLFGQLWDLVHTKCGWGERLSCSNIATGRNGLTARARQAGCGRTLWLDDDVILAPQELWRLVELAWAEDLDVLSGVYPLKGAAHGALAVGWQWDRYESVALGAHGGLYPLEWVAGGCLVIADRVWSAIDELLAARGERELCYGSDSEHWYTGRRYWRETEMPHRGKWVEGGEDIGMSELARLAGCELYADTRVRPVHQGQWLYDWTDALYPRMARASIVLERPSVTDGPLVQLGS